MSDVVGSASFELRATRDKLKQDIAASEADLKAATGRMERDAGAAGDRVGGKMGGIARGLALGITALVATFTAALALAIQFGSASLKMAENLSDSARRIGITTSALQEYQYVARKTGEDAAAVGPALEAFANKLALAQAGLSKSDKNAFAALFGADFDLRSFKNVQDALDQTTDRIGELKSASDKAAIAEQLSLGPLATALRTSADEVANLRDQARDLGFVMDDAIIQKGADAQGRLEDLSQVIGVQLAGAFIDLSDEVIAFTGHIANALQMLNNLAERYSTWKAQTNAMYGDDFVTEVQSGNSGQALMSAVRSVFSGRTTTAAENIRNGGVRSVAAPTLAQLQAFAEGPPAPRTPTLSGRTNLTPVTRTPRADNSEQRAAEREARRAERVEQEIFRARQRLLGLAEGDILTAQERLDLAREQLIMDREARDAEITSKSARGEINAAERRSLEAVNLQADALEDRILTDRAFREIEDERLATERLMAGLASDLLSLQSGAARTAEERRRIELELLEIAQRQRRDALRIELDRNPSLTQDQRNQAMSDNGRRDGLERDAVGRANMSPLEQWRDQALRDAGEIDEAYQRVAANGLDALNSGIVDAIMNSRSLGEVFSNVARQIIADLAAIAVRQSITEPLADMLFGGGKGGKGGGSSIFSTIGNLLGGLKIPGFSSGVTNFSGGLAYVHAGEVLTNLAPGTNVIPAHAVNAMGGGGGYSLTVTPSPYFDAQVQKVSAPGAAQAGMASYQASESQRQRAARVAPYRRG